MVLCAELTDVHLISIKPGGKLTLLVGRYLRQWPANVFQQVSYIQRSTFMVIDTYLLIIIIIIVCLWVKIYIYISYNVIIY